MSKHSEKLKNYLIERSEAKDWETAKDEWTFVGFHLDNGHCPCGQAIVEHCHIKNDRTGELVYVGNTCVQRFLEIDTGKTFAGLKSIMNNVWAKPNEDLTNHAWQCGYIYDNEHSFLMQIINYKRLSEKQEAWKRKIVWRILNKVQVNKDVDLSKDDEKNEALPEAESREEKVRRFFDENEFGEEKNDQTYKDTFG